MIISIFVIIILHLSSSIWTIEYSCDRDRPCGCSQIPSVIGYLIGGESSVPNSWGWAVSLQIPGGHFCGGTIINKDYVLTAAHCTQNKMDKISKIMVCAGINRLDEQCRQRRSVQSIFNHPQYNNNLLANDIALIRVTPPFDLSDTSIKTLCIPGSMDDENYPKPAQELIAIGWGSVTGDLHNGSTTLQQIPINVKEKNEYTCKNIPNNSSIQFCTAALNKG